MATVLVTGANRGLGLEFCRQYAAENWTVIKKLIVNISSLMGSLADNSSGGSIFYRSSKAALNDAI